ncbi:MAG: M23 family metallopeptidase [Azoarcus sp.]|jgi:murein DD-endopeptidase MepM/ murein hydrolase activator NlpD|nr:M23 family metallopeptidase [Azoarcus sp.]
MRTLLFVLALFAWSPALAQNYSAGIYPFRVDELRYQTSQKVQFVAINNSPAPITLSFDATGSNFNSDRALPLALVVEPNSSQDIAEITPRNRLEPFRYSARYSFQPGDPFMSPDRNARYFLPFVKGTSFLVVQSPDSRPGMGILITHNNDHSRFAYDFGVSEGTLVTAAREGIVIDAKDTFTVGRPDPSLSDKGNLVAIMHPDRSIGYYVHLAPHSIIVRIGQHVRAGDAIAYSGNTGYSHGPHLHFDVRRVAISEKGEVVHLSVPIDFYSRDGIGERIQLEDGATFKTR